MTLKSAVFLFTVPLRMLFYLNSEMFTFHNFVVMLKWLHHEESLRPSTLAVTHILSKNWRRQMPWDTAVAVFFRDFFRECWMLEIEDPYCLAILCMLEKVIWSNRISLIIQMIYIWLLGGPLAAKVTRWSQIGIIYFWAICRLKVKCFYR